jgi:hypothetical protein
VSRCELAMRIVRCTLQASVLALLRVCDKAIGYVAGASEREGDQRAAVAYAGVRCCALRVV